MRIHKPVALLLCAIVTCSGCATQTAQRSAPANRGMSQPLRPSPDPGLSPQIEYHADPPQGPSQPVPSPPTAENEDHEVLGVGLSRVLHDSLHKSPCGESCAVEPDPCGEPQACGAADCSSESPCETDDCGEASPCLRLPKICLPKVRMPKVRMPKIRLPKYKFRTCRLPGMFCPAECAEEVVDGCDDECVVECESDDVCADEPCAEGCGSSCWKSGFQGCRLPALFDKCFGCLKPKAECGEGCTEAGCTEDSCGSSTPLDLTPQDTHTTDPMEDPFLSLPEDPVPDIPVAPTPVPQTPDQPQPPAPPQPLQPQLVEPQPVSPETVEMAPGEKPMLAPLAPMPVTEQKYVEPQIWPRLKYQGYQPSVTGRQASWSARQSATSTWQMR